MQTRKSAKHWGLSLVCLLWCGSVIAQPIQHRHPAKAQVAITQDDAILRVACTVYAEAKGESLAGKRAVAGVIYAHAGDYLTKRRTRWVSACHEVCRPGTFSCWNEGWPKAPDLRNPQQRKAWYTCYWLADEVVRRRFTPDFTSHFYHEASIKPYWSKGMTLLCQIDNHKFYK